MTNTDFHARRTELSNTFAAAGAELLDYMGCAGALAAIPNTQQYVVAGDVAAIRAQLDTVAPQRRMRHGDRPELDLYFGPDAGQARRWAALITSAGHGVLQEYGSRFEHAQPGQEVLEVMEILPGAPAIANKAAEEGELQALPELPAEDVHAGDEAFGDAVSAFSAAATREYARAAVVADRASRQVANKAEVEPIGLADILREASGILAGDKEMRGPIVDELDGFASMIEHANPPATTGASTALADMEARKDAAYYERNQVVAALAKCFPSGVAKTAIEGWSEDWHGCVYIDLPTGQASWHFHDSQAHLFDGLPAYVGGWDGHSTDEKYARLAALNPVGASTVLTDETELHSAASALMTYLDEHDWGGVPEGDTSNRLRAALSGHTVAREVAAQAGQVAPAQPLAMVSPGELRDIQAGRGAVPVRGNQWRDDQTVPIYAAPAAGQVAVPGWISTDDRLPENGKDVIILYWPYNNHENERVAGTAHHVEGTFYDEDGNDMHPPSHWMPFVIPEAAPSPAKESK